MASHINDTERVFLSRAFWFARGLAGELPTMNQDACAASARANERSWAHHVSEFRSVRQSTLTFFEGLAPEAWSRTGVASGYTFTVRALAFIVAGHAAHHAAILRERYTG